MPLLNQTFKELSEILLPLQYRMYLLLGLIKIKHVLDCRFGCISTLFFIYYHCLSNLYYLNDLKY